MDSVVNIVYQCLFTFDRDFNEYLTSCKLWTVVLRPLQSPSNNKLEPSTVI